MAALTLRLRHFRPSLHHHLRRLSSTPDPPPPPPPTEPESNRSSFSSYLRDVKSNLQKEPPIHNRPRKPLSFTNSNSARSKIDTEEIKRNLAQFRQRSAPPPPDASGKPVTFGELYNRNVIPNTGAGKSVPAANYDAIRESINRLGPSAAANRAGGLNRGRTTGEKFQIPASIYGKGKLKESTQSILFVHDYAETGKKLEALRPQKKGKSFSLQELNDRFVKVKEEQEKENEQKFGGIYGDLRGSVYILAQTDNNTNRKQNLQALGSLGGTPNYMLSPPKEHLVEQYTHPDHMSSAEKMKLELQKVREEFKMSESDCGSARVQVAQLTTKIKHLSTVLAKKDKHSRKGLIAMVQRRKKLLKYLRRTDWDSYCLVLSKLGLRDNPDIKA